MTDPALRPRVAIKFCGLRNPAEVDLAARLGAGYAGFVFYPPSPRHLELEAARALALAAPPGLAKVALTVDADDPTLDAILARVPVDILQLHGRESPERVAELRARTGLPVMKAIGIREAADLAAIDAYAPVADMLLIDAKPPRGADRPGGNAVAFDWSLIAGRRWPVPWMLAGGLTPANVARAVDLTGARAVDVSSGIESAPGVKSPELMTAFARALA